MTIQILTKTITISLLQTNHQNHYKYTITMNPHPKYPLQIEAIDQKGKEKNVRPIGFSEDNKINDASHVQQEESGLATKLLQNQNIAKQNHPADEAKQRESLTDMIEDTPTYVNVCGLFWRCLVLSLSHFFFGYNLTSLSCMPQVVLSSVYGKNLQNNVVMGGLIGSIIVGICVGVLISPFLMKILSRKKSLLGVNLVALVFTCLLQIGNLYMVCICRLFQGICFACYIELVPCYMNEVIGSGLKRYFLNMPQFMVVLGVDVSYALGLIFEKTFFDASDSSTFQVFWRVIYCVTIITILLQTGLLLTNFIPESPHSLIRDRRIPEAKQVISMFNRQQYVDRILQQKMLQVESANLPNIIVIKTPSKPIRLIFLGFSLTIMQQMNGITAVVTQAGHLLNSYDPGLGEYTPITITTVQLLATLTSAVVIQSMGVKANIMMGNLGMGLFNMFNAVMFYFIGWTPAVSLILFGLILNMIIFGTTLGNSVGVYVPSIVPERMLPLANMLGWIACAVCVIGMPVVMNFTEKQNPYPAFFFFACWTIFFFIVNVILISFKTK